MGIHYSQEIIGEILDRNDIVNIVSEYVKLERKGSNHWGVCPFHNEKTPSFSVTPVKQIFYCFGCQKGGNAIHFISQIENIGYYDAVKLLAERSGIVLPEGNDEKEIEKARIKKAIIEINTESARFFRDKLLGNRGALEYFSKRGVSERIIRSFGLGYAPDEWNALYKHLKSKNYDEFILDKSGLFTKDKHGGVIDRYRNRVMFPIFDLMGNVIAFGGRVLDNSKPKYINSPETPAYSKGRHLYALNFAKKQQKKQMIIVEGYMDVISLHQAGITNVVASLGTALTDSQGRILKKYCDEVIISYDADGAGQKAALRGLDILNKLECRVKVLKIPEGKDPDDYVKKNGSEQFNAIVRNAMSLVEYKAEYIKSDLDVNTTDGKTQFMKRLTKLLASIENMVEREMYIKRFAEIYSVSEEALIHDVIKMTGGETKPIRPNVENKARKMGKDLERSIEEEKILKLEMLLLTLLCSDNSIFLRIRGKITPQWFYDKENERLAKEIFESLENGNQVQIDILIDLAAEENRGKFAEISMNECTFEDNIRAASDIAQKRDILKNNIRRKEIIGLLGEPDIDSEKKKKLNSELKEILMKK